jgi:Arc/MetJ-type ribon-helix-helix transcriptional regulator
MSTAPDTSTSQTDDRKDHKVDVRLTPQLFAKLEEARHVFGSRSAAIREALTRLP